MMREYTHLQRAFFKGKEKVMGSKSVCCILGGMVSDFSAVRFSSELFGWDVGGGGETGAGGSGTDFFGKSNFCCFNF